LDLSSNRLNDGGAADGVERVAVVTEDGVLVVALRVLHVEAHSRGDGFRPTGDAHAKLLNRREEVGDARLEGAQGAQGADAVHCLRDGDREELWAVVGLAALDGAAIVRLVQRHEDGGAQPVSCSLINVAGQHLVDEGQQVHQLPGLRVGLRGKELTRAARTSRTEQYGIEATSPAVLRGAARRQNSQGVRASDRDSVSLPGEDLSRCVTAAVRGAGFRV